MSECSAISDLPAPRPTMKSTSHFGANDGDEPGFGGKDDACRRGALESSITPHVAGGRRRARPAGPAAPGQSGGRAPPLSGSNILRSERAHVPLHLGPTSEFRERAVKAVRVIRMSQAQRPPAAAARRLPL